MGTLDISAPLAAVIVALLSFIGTIITAVLSYISNRKIDAVKEQTDGMSKRLERAAFKDGQDDGKAKARPK